MSEALRDLVVSLSLQTDNFTRNIRSVNRQIQEAESHFRQAAAGVEGFEQSAAGLSTKLSTLERKLSLQQDAVDQYERALQAANTRLQECYDRQTDYASRLQNARAAQAALKQQVQAGAQAVQHYSQTLGANHSATIAAQANLDRLKEEYRLSVAEVRKLSGQNAALEKSTQNAADAVSQANTNLNNARAAVQTTEAEIEQCNQALRLAQTEWDAAGKAIKANTTAINSFGKQIGLAESKFRLASAGIKELDKSVPGLTAKLTMLGDKVELQEKQVQKYEQSLEEAKRQLLAAQQANDPDKIQEATDAVTEAETALNNARAELKQTRSEIEETNRHLRTAQSMWTELGEDLTAVGERLKKTGDLFTEIGQTLTTTVTAPVLALGATAIKASISFESAFTSVRKTVDATDAQFTQLSADIKQMSTEVATSADDIAEVVAIAGQLGIETDYLTDFARTMIDLGTSTDIVASDAASTLAKFANITGMDQSQFGNLGAALVDLGNNYATTESSIMTMSMRLAAAGHQVGLSEAQILGFAAALSSVGIEAEMGGSAFSKALVKMEVAAATGGDALDDFAQVSGMTSAQFKSLWDSDPAAAFQAFIVGLSQMDEEGMSAIATLQDIGIAEVRLRDTLLRAVNATELFAETQQTATRAWAENTALTTEAGKRYATTESQLINLKNKAMLFAQQLGDDLNPTIKELISGADDMLDRFLELDEAQRQQIIEFAMTAASVGPVLLAYGKVSKGIGTITTGIGKFATAVGKAGGGAKGFFTVLGKSPSVWMAVAVAAIAATTAIVDYASGARQAREALEGMAETAENWRNTAADTFYGRSDGLSFFGMSDADFERETGDMQGWMDGILAVWSDGKKETNAIVKQWQDSFKAITATTRTELQELKASADENGYTSVSDSLAADIAQLDAIDKEMDKLIKRRQNGRFTDKDKQRMQELIDMRGAIEIKYHLTEADTDGFDTIRKKLEAEVARAQARGQADASVTVYENAMVASAEGMAAVNRQLDEQYDKEYALVMLIEDAAERQAALDDLNARYLNDRKAAAVEYANLLAGIVMPVWEQADIQKVNTDMDTLVQLMREYSTATQDEKPAILEQMNKLTAGMDESAVTEYVAMLTQIQSLLDSGMTEDEVSALFPEIDFSSALEQIAAIQAFLNGRPGALPGLESMFGEALPEEVLKIATDLDMTGAQARWNEFAANPGAITTTAVVSSYTEAVNATKQQPTVDAFIGKYTEVAEGADKSSLTPTGLVAYVTKYAEVTNGADMSGLTPDNITAMVAAYQELAAGADITQLTPDEITAYIMKYLESEGVDTSNLTPDAVTAFVLAYEEITGGASTTALTPDDITAMVVKYLEAEDVDVSNLTPDQIEAIVSSFAEATGCDKSTLMQNFVAYIARYDDTNAEKPTLTVTIGLSGYDLVAYRRFIKEHPVEVAGIVKLGETYENPAEALLDPQTKFWQNGTEIPVTAVTEEMLTANSVAVLDEDGTMHILITPEVTGSPEALEAANELIHSTDHQGSLGAQWFNMDTMADIKRLNEYLSDIQWQMDSVLNIGGWMNRYNRWASAETTSNYLDPEEFGNLQIYVAEAVAALNSGQPVSEEMVGNLQQILQLIKYMEGIGFGSEYIGAFAESMSDAGMETTPETLVPNLEMLIEQMNGVGADAAAGVGEGMAAADMSTYGITVADNTEAALRSGAAFNSASPANRTKPVGRDVALGIGVGMAETDLSSYASATSSHVLGALRANLNASSLRSTGVLAMSGLAAGIIAGRSQVITAMRNAARAAVNTAKQTLDIHSPSRVFRDEVGAMTMEGFGEGVLRETEAQAKIIRNASRFLTDEAQAGAISTTSTDNRRTYNNNVSSTVQVAQMVVRDDQDIRALAIEIASLTRRQQRGRGLRMA